ncbi:hypothetical protein ACFPH6_41030 [Streptomyces xiangluensis]|uniref:Uncharacterized protein n=1 Tax=Streptomyces xiangluensis TaxID=2665720 RepID=A0ABV8Z2L2_9ACTN
MTETHAAANCPLPRGGWPGGAKSGVIPLSGSNEVKGTKVTKNSDVAYGARVVKDADGVWELMEINSTRGAAKCQP